MFIVSHDDVYNAAHFMNDVMSVWTMLVLSQRSPKEAVLLNIDGLNYIGASGGEPHRLMNPSSPDTLEMPFIEIYRSIFSEVKSLGHYQGGKVCFREAYVIPPPSLTWVWNGWRHPSACSFKMPSSLYQSFNLFLRRSIEQSRAGGELSSTQPPSVPSPPGSIHVVLAVRGAPKDNLSEGVPASQMTSLQCYAFFVLITFFFPPFQRLRRWQEYG